MAISMVSANWRNMYYGLSTDTKPTDDYVPNASSFYEMDTGKVYLYDAENKVWIVQ